MREMGDVECFQIGLRSIEFGIRIDSVENREYHSYRKSARDSPFCIHRFYCSTLFCTDFRGAARLHVRSISMYAYINMYIYTIHILMYIHYENMYICMYMTYTHVYPIYIFWTVVFV